MICGDFIVDERSNRWRVRENGFKINSLNIYFPHALQCVSICYIYLFYLTHPEKTDCLISHTMWHFDSNTKHKKKKKSILFIWPWKFYLFLVPYRISQRNSRISFNFFTSHRTEATFMYPMPTQCRKTNIFPKLILRNFLCVIEHFRATIHGKRKIP